ncbi:MAG: hypothetical protein KBG62_04195 [Propionivibrio sp.]|nr:hypothetical protein [Propionivibrio sp.]
MKDQALRALEKGKPILAQALSVWFSTFHLLRLFTPNDEMQVVFVQNRQSRLTFTSH